MRRVDYNSLIRNKGQPEYLTSLRNAVANLPLNNKNVNDLAVRLLHPVAS